MPTYPANYPIVNQLPADPSLPEHADIQTLTRSLNTHGAYIHKIHHVLQNATVKLEKIRMRQIPTPASLVGVGTSGTFHLSNQFSDEMATGLLFKTDTPCVMAHKRAFGSNVLIGEDVSSNLPPADGFTQPNTQEAALKTFSTQLIDRYREKARRQVACHVPQVRDKLREIEIRSNLGQCRAPDAETALQMRDVSSKALIRLLMQARGCNSSERWTAESLIAFIHECSENDASLRAQLAHAIPKIQSYDNDESLNSWLNKHEKTNPNRYATEFKKNGTAKVPSECLILPTTNHVIGISVELAYPGSIDNAVYLNSLLPAPKPAFLLCISDKRHGNLIAMDWTRDLLPLSKHGMQQFLLTGYIMDAAGHRQKPDLFSAMHQIALHGQIRFVQDRVGENVGWFYPPGLVAPNPTLDMHHFNAEKLKRKFNNTNPLVQLMSACMPAALQKRSDNEVTTALEQVIKNGESESVVRYFFHFCPPEKRPDADAVQRLETRYSRHPAMPALSRLVGMTPEQQEADRINLLTQEFDRLGSPQSMSFDLRSGWHETGKARFIPELMGFRVTEGVFHADYVSDTQFEGLARYSHEQEDMSLCVGVKKHQGDIVEAGFFQPDENLIPRLTSGCTTVVPTELYSTLDRPAFKLNWCLQNQGAQSDSAKQQLSFAVFTEEPSSQDTELRPSKLILAVPDENGNRHVHILDLVNTHHPATGISVLQELQGSAWQSDMGQSQLSTLISTLESYILAGSADAEKAQIKLPGEEVEQLLQSAKQFQQDWNTSINFAIQSNGGMTVNANSIFQRSVGQHVNEQFPTLDVRHEYPLSAATAKADGRTFSESELHQIAQFRNDLALYHPDIICNTDHLPAGHQYDQLTADVARCLQRDLHRVYPHETRVSDQFNHNTRYTVSSLRNNPPTQSNWVHHVFGLLRLRSTLSAHHVDALQKYVRHANGGAGPHGANRSRSKLPTAISQLQGCDVSDALLKLYLHDTQAHPRGIEHNTHLSSVALQTVTGLVYHPLNNLVESPAHGQALPTPLIENHPGSFKQFPFVLLTRYCAALKNNSLEDFFNSAFIRQRPCYEDVQENILNYGGIQTHDHPRPAWNTAWSLNDNMLGQFAWVQRQALIRKLNAEGRDISQLSAHDWDALESSPAFAEELKLQADALWLQMREAIPQAQHNEALQVFISELALTDAEQARLVPMTTRA